MSVIGMACTVAWTELVQALRADGVDVPDKSGPATAKWIEGIAAQDDGGVRVPRLGTPEMLAIFYSAATGGDWLPAPLPLTKRQLARARNAYAAMIAAAPIPGDPK